MRGTAGKIIQHYRRKKGWKQRELASASGIPISNLSQYERGLVEPSYDKFERLIAAMGYQVAIQRKRESEDEKNAESRRGSDASNGHRG